MANFNHVYQVDRRSTRIDYLFYFASILLAAVVLSYFIFGFKIHLQEEMMESVETKSLSLNTGDRQAYNKKILNYKKKIDDFNVLLGNHKITSSLFNFIESKTLANVWFSDFSIQKETNELRLSGQTDDMESLSRQIQVFEQDTDVAQSITVLSSEANTTGKVNFILNVILNSEVFNYQSPSSKIPNLNESNP